MAKIEKYELTHDMMQAAQDIADDGRAKRFKYPKSCPNCKGNKLCVWVPNPEYVAFKLVDEEWEYHEEDNYDGDILELDRAKYHCEDCDEDFEATIANGWAAEAMVSKRKMEK